MTFDFFINKKFIPDDKVYMYDKEDLIIHTIYCHERVKGGYIVKSKDYMWIRKRLGEKVQ